MGIIEEAMKFGTALRNEGVVDATVEITLPERTWRALFVEWHSRSTYVSGQLGPPRFHVGSIELVFPNPLEMLRQSECGLAFDIGGRIEFLERCVVAADAVASGENAELVRRLLEHLKIPPSHGWLLEVHGRADNVVGYTAAVNERSRTVDLYALAPGQIGIAAENIEPGDVVEIDLGAGPTQPLRIAQRGTASVRVRLPADEGGQVMASPIGDGSGPPLNMRETVFGAPRETDGRPRHDLCTRCGAVIDWFEGRRDPNGALICATCANR